jgi:pimeloyl-ACP methyl ester carboxylesterase
MRGRAPSHLLAALLPSLIFAISPASSAGSSLSFAPCPTGTELSCASLAVPLARDGAAPGAITLSVERKLAGATPTTSAVLALAGGPGQATLPLSDFIAQAIAPALGTRDLLLFDQRGTGTSNPLSCVALSAPEDSIAGSRFSDCANELGPARGAYTTAESVEDIETLRQAAGYEKLVLYGTSYGTKVALDYAERYPQHVEALVLYSTETPSGPEPFGVNTFKAMGSALDEVCAHDACSSFSRDSVADLAALISRTNASPLAGYVYDGHGQRVKVRVSTPDLYGLMLEGDLNPALRADMPAAIKAAVEHDLNPLLRLLALRFESTSATPSTEENNEIDGTLFYDTSCEETAFPWQREAPEATRAIEAERALRALPASDFYPFTPEAALLQGNIPECVQWPDASPPPPGESALPDVPTLILSGGQDLRTPTENARAVAKLIPDAQLLKVPFTGHSVIGSDLSGCSKAALAQFFAGQRVAPCPSAANPFPPVPLAPRSLAQLNPTGKVRGMAGRGLTAALDTVGDLRRTIIEIGLDVDGLPVGARFGGLRGGSVAMSKSAAVLSRLSYVPGVQLSGEISANLVLMDKGATSMLDVSGSAGVSGKLRLSSGGRVAGELNGVRFDVKLLKATAARGAVEQPAPGGEWPDLSDPLQPASLSHPR